jgi:hypothetical protein
MMKKIAFVLAVLVMAAPAMAVNITVTAGPGPNDFTVSYDDGAGVRAFALDIVLDDPCMTIEAVNCVSADYFVYPGSISISDAGVVTGDGTCNCGVDGNTVCIEMGSLYLTPEATLDLPAGEVPAASGDLVIVTLGGCDDGGDGVGVSVSENVIRGGVVMEDGSAAAVTSPGGTVTPALPDCRIPHCWDSVIECGGQPLGDSDCDGAVNFIDLGRLKASFFTSYPGGGYDCCSDYNQDQSVNFLDLGILKANFFSSGHTPATGQQNCDPIPWP